MSEKKAYAMIGVVVILLYVAWRSSLGFSPRDEPAGDPLIFEEQGPDRPFLFLTQFRGYAHFGGKPRSNVRVAVWQDGRIVRVLSPENPGKDYVEGILKPEQLDELVGTIERSGILSVDPDRPLAPDANYADLTIRTRGGRRTWLYLAGYDTIPQAERIERALWEIEIPDAKPSPRIPGIPASWYE